jgi:hypothetical protein
MKRYPFALISLLAAGASFPADGAGDDAAIERLLERIVRQEQQFVNQLRGQSAIVETYIQETPPEGAGEPAPEGTPAEIVRDHYFLGQVRFGGELQYTEMASRGEPSRGSRLLRLFRSRSAAFVAEGFAQMALIDPEGFSRKNYRMEFVRREFLGELRCLIFEVAPLDVKAAGRFKGRIWVEDQGFQIVRFNGLYTNSSSSRLYFHFDSWRVNVASGQWVPGFVYVEESGVSEKGPAIPRFKAQTRLWGYGAASHSRTDELASVAVEAETGVKDQAATPEATPLENQRAWERQAEANILERLEKAGLLAPGGPVDEVLNTVVGNLIAANSLAVDAHCRVLLTTPLETFSVGRTIVISRGLIDVLPDESSLAVVLSGELAHIALGHRTNTNFAFADQTMLGEQDLLSRLRLFRSVEEVKAAGNRAIQLLTNSPYGGKLANAGLFLKALETQAPQLPNLIRANLGNQLASGTSLIQMKELAAKAPPLERDKLEQLAALPLGSRVRLDPWTGEIFLSKAKPVSLISARDKLPFEVTPFMIFLSRAGARTKDQNPAQANLAPVQP